MQHLLVELLAVSVIAFLITAVLFVIFGELFLFLSGSSVSDRGLYFKDLILKKGHLLLILAIYVVIFALVGIWKLG